MKKIYKVTTMCLAMMVIASGTLVFSQIGSGWNQYNPSKTLQRENSEKYSFYENKNGVETFKLWKNPSGARQRVEQRVNDNYTSGATQFQGEFYMVKAGGPQPGDDVCIMQVWLSIMVSVSDYGKGTIYMHGAKMIDNVIGKWVKINVIHSANTNTASIYFNGSKKWSGKSKDSNPFYHKYGLYNCAGAKPIVMWKNIKYYKSSSKSADVEDVDLPAPAADVTVACGPNPVVDNAVISYNIPETAATKMVLYNIFGQEVKTLLNSNHEAGQFSLSLDASGLAKGVYILDLVSGASRSTCKILVQ